MRVVNENFETITEYDLTAGRLVPSKAIREDAEPIDDVEKFAWADEDWEDVQMYILDEPADPNAEPAITDRVAELEATINVLLGVTE